MSVALLFVALLTGLSVWLVRAVVSGPDASTVARSQSLRVGFAVEAPYAFINAQGRVTGEAPEVFRHMAQRVGIEQIDWIRLDFANLLPELRLGRIDAIAAGMYITPERAEQAAFTRPTATVRTAVVLREGETALPQRPVLADLARAADWLSARLPDPAAPLGCVGFCFGGHVAMLAATLPRIAATCDFYGAGVASGRPGGGPPTLEEVPRIPGRLLCFCGEADPLIPEADVEAIAAAIAAAPDAARHRLIRVPGAGHGYLCEARADHRPEAAAQGWRAMLDFFGEVLGR